MDARNLKGPLAGLFCLASLAGCSGSGGSGGEEPPPPGSGGSHSLSMVTVADGLAHPWAMAFLPDGDILVTERPGRLRLVRDGQLLDEPVSGLPEDIQAEGQGGLLDIELHPDFETNRFIYFSYSADTGAGLATRVARAVYENGTLTSTVDIFEAAPARPGGRHFGSRLVFDRRGDDQIFLYISLGERGDRDQAQNPGSHLGTIVRIYDDNREPPADNPVWTDGLAEVFSIGHRNPQGLTRHPQTGRIWSHEHGPEGGDEVNIIRPGRNYGWPKATHGTEYNTHAEIGPDYLEGVEPPLYYWEPTSIAPSGMTFYTGSRFPDWQGDLFIGALAARALVRLEVDGERITGEEHLLKSANMRIRDVAQGPDGYLWILTDHDPGQLIRLEPVP